MKFPRRIITEWKKAKQKSDKKLVSNEIIFTFAASYIKLRFLLSSVG